MILFVLDMKRLALLLLSGSLCSSLAFAGKFVTAKGGDPTPISSSGGVFSFDPVNGGGVFFYQNIGPGAITELSVQLTVTAGPGQMPYSFQATTVSPTSANQLSELDVTGLESPPVGTSLLNWDFSSYIFSNISLAGTTTGFDCSGNANSRDACLTIDFTNGSIGIGQDFGFDLNTNFTADIDTQTGVFNPNAATNPPSGGFGGVQISFDPSGGPAAVPEPASTGLIGLAGICFAVFAWRRSRA